MSAPQMPSVPAPQTSVSTQVQTPSSQQPIRAPQPPPSDSGNNQNQTQNQSTQQQAPQLTADEIAAFRKYQASQQQQAEQKPDYGTIIRQRWNLQQPTMGNADPNAQVTQADMLAYQRQMDQYNRTQQFIQDFVQKVSGPISFGEGDNAISLGYNNQAQINGLLSFTEQLRQQPLTPEQIIILHRFPEILQLARESSARTVERTQTRPNNPRSQPQTVVPDPNQVQQTQQTTQTQGQLPPTVDENGRPLTIEQMLLREDPNFMKNWQQRTMNDRG